MTSLCQRVSNRDTIRDTTRATQGGCASLDERQATAKAPAPAIAPGRRWRSAELFGPGREVEIEHGQAVYRLRMTALGKLILTK